MSSALYTLPTNCEFALATLGLYDYCLTFNQEIRQIWQRKFSWITFLFFVNRYTIIATSVVILIKDLRFIGPASVQCTNLVLAQIVLDATLSICAACFFAAQMYALFNRPTILLFVTTAFGLACPIISLGVWAKAATISLTPGQVGERCSTLSALEFGAYDKWLLAARACNLAANCLVLSMIVYKTYMTTRYITGSNLSLVLVKQGALFFVAIAAPNIVALALTNVPILGANIPLHADSTTSILISRFVMTLRRRFSDTEVHDDLGYTLQFSDKRTEIVFQRQRASSTCVYSVL